MKATIDSVAAVIAEPTSGFFAILYIVFSFFLMVLCEPFGWASLLSDSNRALFCGVVLGSLLPVAGAGLQCVADLAIRRIAISFD